MKVMNLWATALAIAVAITAASTGVAQTQQLRTLRMKPVAPSQPKLNMRTAPKITKPNFTPQSRMKFVPQNSGNSAGGNFSKQNQMARPTIPQWSFDANKLQGNIGSPSPKPNFPQVQPMKRPQFNPEFRPNVKPQLDRLLDPNLQRPIPKMPHGNIDFGNRLPGDRSDWQQQPEPQPGGMSDFNKDRFVRPEFNPESLNDLVERFPELGGLVDRPGMQEPEVDTPQKDEPAPQDGDEQEPPEQEQDNPDDGDQAGQNPPWWNQVPWLADLLAPVPPRPFCPPGIVCPPAPPVYMEQPPVAANPDGPQPTPDDTLPRAANGAQLTLIVDRAKAESPGRAALLIGENALPLRITSWQSGVVLVELPTLLLAEPQLARIYLADDQGTIIDAQDFVLLPTR